jgi:hypothetical protein
MTISFEPGRGEVKVLMKISWMHSFCVAKQREMGVLIYFKKWFFVNANYTNKHIINREIIFNDYGY